MINTKSTNHWLSTPPQILCFCSRSHCLSSCLCIRLWCLSSPCLCGRAVTAVSIRGVTLISVWMGGVRVGYVSVSDGADRRIPNIGLSVLGILSIVLLFHWQTLWSWLLCQFHNISYISKNWHNFPPKKWSNKISFYCFRSSSVFSHHPDQVPSQNSTVPPQNGSTPQYHQVWT